jgi:hypothetical protein
MNCNTIVCSNLTTGTNEVVLIPNTPIKTLRNTGNYRLILATNIPEATSNFPVSIQVGENNIPVLCKYGNQIYASQLNRRVNYPIGYGNQNAEYTNGQFVITSCNCLNPRSTVTTATTNG